MTGNNDPGRSGKTVTARRKTSKPPAAKKSRTRQSSEKPAGVSQALISPGPENNSFKQAEGPLQVGENITNSEQPYKSIVQNIPGLVYRIHAREQNRIRFFNKASESLTGFSDHELCHGEICSIESRMHPEDRPKVISQLKDAIAAGLPFSVEYRFLHKDGSIKYFVENGVPINAGDGKLLYIDGIIVDITGRRLAEERIAESEKQMRVTSLYTRSLIEASLDPLVTISKEGKITDVNEATEIVTGVPREELIGSDFSDYFTEPERAREGYWQVFEQGNVKDYPLAIRHKSGDITDVLYNATLYRDPTGQVQGVFAAARDITKRKRTEKLLSDSEAKYRAAIETSSDGFWINDREGRIIEVNDAYLKQSGYSRGELLNMNIKDIEAIEKPEDTSEHIQKIIRNGGDLFETKHLRKDGHEWDVEVNIIHWPTVGDRFFCFFRDITGRKKVEEEMRISEKRLRQAQYLARIGNWIYDLQSGSLWWSDELHRVFSLRPEDGPVTLELFLSRVHPDDRKELETQIASGMPFRSDYRIIMPDGRIKYIHEEVEIHRSQDGKDISYEGTAQDITESKEAEEKIRASLKEKEVLLREIHHRVKNNMQVISSLLNLQSQYIRDKESAVLFTESRNRIKSMALIHEKLYLSGDMAKIDFISYIKNLADSLFKSYGADKGRIALHVSKGDVIFKIDTAVPCGLIVNELLSNSLKYAFPDNREGEINISLQPLSEDEYELTVGDNGIGIPEDFGIMSSKSLGLKLVEILTKQLRGKMEHIRGNGTMFKVAFKELKQHKGEGNA